MRPSPEQPLTRRRFVCTATVAALGAPAIGRASIEGLSWRFLTAAEAKTLAVLADVIIPPDQDPGGAWADVVQFIDRKLVGYHRAHQQLYRQGLVALDASSRQLYQQPVVELGAARRIELFAKWEKGQLPPAHWKDTSQSEFFNRLLEHVLQGFLGGPRHGGNREAVSWRMLGLPQPPVRSRRPESPRLREKP